DHFLRPEVHRERDHLRPRQYQPVVRVDAFELSRLHPPAYLAPVHPEHDRRVGDGVGGAGVEEEFADVIGHHRLLCVSFDHAADTYSRWRVRLAQVQMRYECATRSSASSASASASCEPSEISRRNDSPSLQGLIETTSGKLSAPNGMWRS